jgi:multisubunit Na+/H+ antiporter MnhC subunit
MAEIILTIIVVGMAVALFGTMVYALVSEGRLVLKENRKLKRATRFIDPLPDVLRITAEQARELERWPVLDKSNRG